MNEILDNESYSIEERLDMAKELLIMKERQIQQLQARLDNDKSNRRWIQNQSSDYRMGL